MGKRHKTTASQEHVWDSQDVAKRIQAHHEAPTRSLRVTSKEALILPEWHNEWWTTSDDSIPSGVRPFSLLTEPANINLKTHTRKARRTYLGHWDANNEPVGCMDQRFKQEEKERKRIEKILGGVKTDKKRAQDFEPGQSRKKVRKVAKEREVIDLTEDEDPVFHGSRQLINVEDLENSTPPNALHPYVLPTTHLVQSKLGSEVTSWMRSEHTAITGTSMSQAHFDYSYTFEAFDSLPSGIPQFMFFIDNFPYDSQRDTWRTK